MSVERDAMRTTLLAVLLVVGCETHEDDDWPEHCPDPDSDRVTYRHDTWAERDICHVIDFACGPGEEPIVEADCGCGCMDTLF